MKPVFTDRFKNYYLFLFFFIFLLIGVFVFQDYGMTPDEKISRFNGSISAKYVISLVNPEFALSNPSMLETPDLHTWKDKDYGVFFELPVVLLEKALKIEDKRDVFFMRHLSAFIVFWIASIFFYKIVRQKFNSWQMGLFGASLLFISPRIFADAFYNSKDLVFMSLIIICIYTQLRYFKNPHWVNILWHSLACAAAINIRIMGIIVPLLTLGIILLDFIKNYSEYRIYDNLLKPIFGFSITLIFLTILFWPFLWKNPIDNFLMAFQNMAKFRYKDPVLYLGELIKPNEIPWHYIPLWILLTTPVSYSLLFLIGSLKIGFQILKNKLALYNNEEEKENIIFLSLCYGPILAVIILNSVLYDAWRQLFFVYPAFLMISLVGFQTLWKGIIRLHSSKFKFLSAIVVLLLAFDIFKTMLFMIKEHPYQNVYFSFLPAESVEKNFERDYWGSSYREAMEYVLSKDKSDTIYFHANMEWAISTLLILKPEDRERVIYIEKEKDISKYLGHKFKPLYFFTNYRLHPNQYPYENEIFQKKVDGIKIMSVFKIN